MRGRFKGQRQYSSWDRARLSVVVPIGVIVAVAILCIVVAVLSSAQRADEIAVEGERQMFARAVKSYTARILREVESVAASDDAVRNLRLNYDPDWTRRRLGNWLDAYFDHDSVFLIGGDGEIVYGHSRWRRPDAAWLALGKADLAPVLRTLHGGNTASERRRTVVVGTFIGRPAIIAAAMVGEEHPGAAGERDAGPDVPGAPIVASVKIIDQEVLSEIAAHLRFKNLRRVTAGNVAPGDFVYPLASESGETIAHYAWTPNQPGAEIFNNVLPFLATALAGFALLAAFVLRYMRRTAAAIVAGEKRLHHLAMHDPLCGLPNRAFFTERLEQVIEEVKYGGPPAALFYIDLDHFNPHSPSKSLILLSGSQYFRYKSWC